MGGFFSLDNKLFVGINKVVDCIYLSLVWLICSLPIVTMGASTTALYYTVNKVIKNNHGYVTKEFFHAFAANFKQSTIVWLIFLVVGAFMGTDAYIMWNYLQAENAVGNLFYLFLAFLALEIMWGLYLFPYIARFENTTKMIMKNAALIGIVNFGKTLLLFLAFGVCVFFIWLIPLLVFIIPTILMLIMNSVLEKVFRKYMSQEDIEQEEERNQEYLN